MKLEGGVPTKQRKVHDRFYVPSFSGASAVEWVKREKNLIERDHAQRILQRLLRAGVIKPLKPATSTEEPIFSDDEKVYYYFSVRTFLDNASLYHLLCFNPLNFYFPGGRATTA